MQSLESNPAGGVAANARPVVAALQEVTVTFDSYLSRALTDVSLEIRRGEV